MDFGEILSKAWKIIWKNKILWVFGILAGLGQGSAGGSGSGNANVNGNFSFDTNNFNFDSNNLQGIPPEIQNWLQQLNQYIQSIQWWWIVLLVLVLLVISLILWAISIVGKVGLIEGTKQADIGAQQLSLGSLLRDSFPYFWRVIGFSLLTGFGLMIILLVLMVPMILFAIASLGIGLLLILPLICLLVPAMWLVEVYLKQVVIAIVVEDCGIMAGFKHGWAVFKSNFWNMVLMAVILGVGSGVMSFIISLPLVLAVAPLLAPVIQTFSGSSFDLTAFQVPGLITLVLLCLFTPVVILLRGMLAAYVQSAWTLTYRRFTRPAAAPIAPDSNLEILPPLPDPS